MRRDWVKAAIALCLGCGGGLLLVELAVRFFVPRPFWEFRDATSDWQVDDRIGWVNRPDLRAFTRLSDGRAFWFETNGDGVSPAGCARDRRRGVLRVMVFGDSTVVGRAVLPTETVRARIEARLRGRGIDAEVINAGVQGYSTDQALLLMERLVPLYRPDAVLHAVCGNDFGAIALGRAYGLNKPRFIRDPGGLREVPPAGNREVGMLGSGLRHGVQFIATYRLLQPAIFALRSRLGRWEERQSLGLAWEVYYCPEAMERIDWGLFSALVMRMDACCRGAGAKFFLYGHPALEEVWDPFVEHTMRARGVGAGSYDRHALEKRLAGVAAGAGIAFVPMIDEFLARKGEGPFHLLPLDPHCNARGYDVTAERLVEAIMRCERVFRPAADGCSGRCCRPGGATGW